VSDFASAVGRRSNKGLFDNASVHKVAMRQCWAPVFIYLQRRNRNSAAALPDREGASAGAKPSGPRGGNVRASGRRRPQPGLGESSFLANGFIFTTTDVASFNTWYKVGGRFRLPPGVFLRVTEAGLSRGEPARRGKNRGFLSRMELKRPRPVGKFL